MNKDFTDFLSKFNSLEFPSNSDYLKLFEQISTETDLSSKLYKALDSLQNKLIKNQNDILTNKELLFHYFNQVLVMKNKNLFDFIINWLVNFYYKLEDKERETIILELIFLNLMHNNYAKIDIEKRFNLEEHSYYKMISLNYDFLKKENLQRINYVWDCLEKKTGGLEKSKESKIKLKNKKILEKLVLNYNSQILDYLLILIFYKVKNNINKLDIELEKTNLKNVVKFYPESANYFLNNLIFIPFDTAYSNNFRKLMIFLNILLIKTLGVTFLTKIFKQINIMIVNKENFINKISFLNFEILQDSFPYSLQNIDSSKFIKGLESLLIDMIGIPNVINNQNLNTTDEINENKVIDKFIVLKEFILLMEYLITNYSGVNCINMESVYSFYFTIQSKLLNKFTTLPDVKKKKFYEVQVNIGNIQKIISKYNTNYAELNQIISQILSLFYSENGTSLIFQNWLIFIFKNGTILDAFKILRIFLITKKEGSHIYSLLKMPYEVKKFYPTIWKIVLESFLVDSSNRNSEENYNLITNLKYIFYYELSLKTSENPMKEKSIFYDSLSYDCTVILKFFKHKFSILSSFFFSDESLIEKVLASSEDLDMDICFETYINNTSSSKNNQNIDKRNSGKAFDKKTNTIHIKTKIEILNTLSFLLNSFGDQESVSQDIIKFIIDLFDALVLRTEDEQIIEHISNLFSLIITLYKKENKVSTISASPIKVIFSELVKHTLKKVLSNTTTNEFNYHNKYFEYFKELYLTLNQEEDNLISDYIVYSIKELVYANVDNQSFRNPVTLKNMQGLNDFDEKITEKEHLPELLEMLKSYYQRWIPQNYSDLVNKLNHFNLLNAEKVVVHLYDYLKEFPPVDNTQMQVELEDGRSTVMKKFEMKFKVLVFENINVLNS